MRDGGCQSEAQDGQRDLGDGDAEDGHPLVLLLLRRLRFLSGGKRAEISWIVVRTIFLILSEVEGNNPSMSMVVQALS